MFVAKDMAVALGCLFESSVELKTCYMFYADHKMYLLLPVGAVILASWWVLDLFCFHHFVACHIHESHQSVSVNS